VRFGIKTRFTIAAILDRRLHNGQVGQIQGRSYRLKDKRKAVIIGPSRKENPIEYSTLRSSGILCYREAPPTLAIIFVGAQQMTGYIELTPNGFRSIARKIVARFDVLLVGIFEYRANCFAKRRNFIGLSDYSFHFGQRTTADGGLLRVTRCIEYLYIRL